MTTEVKPLAEINQQAIRLLYRELGVVNAVRFLKQFTTGFGDYTKERDVLFGDKTLDEIVSDIEQRRTSSS
ncbi:MAG: hypothetical protein NZ699_12240 [Roseiflexus sp.]|nr:hypothetical protein [Roseiflexus sp.]MDW8145169.1 hypothetical protein [Roseiflexaceae bacterium]MDW8234197.1 hypothetical protein [Roseiflexaceae bacterium]